MKMDDRLQILVCKIYQREVSEIIRRRQWSDVDLLLHPQICRKGTGGEGIEVKPGVLVLDTCFALKKQSVGESSAHFYSGECFNRIVNRTLVDYLISQGSYVMTPGWLEDWALQIKQWGFDRPMAREFFHESMRKLVLLDTGVNPESSRQLQDVGDYLNMPVENLPVGLDYFDLFLSRAVSDWRFEKSRRDAEDNIASYHRDIADYSMAFDLLMNLTHIRSENEAAVEISDLFTMLFSPGSVTYCSIEDGKLNDQYACKLDTNECEALSRWALMENDDYVWTSSGHGFYLRLKYQDKTVAVLCLENLRLPQHKTQYLNLSLSIARLCGLAITNARTFEKLQKAESLARHEKEISETLRQVMTELASNLDLPDVLARILKSLFKVIPSANVSIFMSDSGRLNFRAGMQRSLRGEIAPYKPSLERFDFDPSRFLPASRIIPDLAQYPKMQKYFGGDHIHGWMGVSLILHGEIIGYLSISSSEIHAYSDEDAALAQTFANQAAIAIENARLFKEVQILAITEPLTGLYNRRRFYNLAETEFKRSFRYKRPLSIVMLDIDYFKRVNDTYGHPVGDQVLIALADCCKKKVRGADLAARYGGEEFVLLLPETNLFSAEALAERLRLEIAAIRIPNDRGDVQITVSLGVACLDEGCENIEELLRRCDQALYLAKEGGRNCVCLWVKPDQLR